MLTRLTFRANCTHTVFHVDQLKPYRDTPDADFEVIAPRFLDLPKAGASEQGCQAELQPDLDMLKRLKKGFYRVKRTLSLLKVSTRNVTS